MKYILFVLILFNVSAYSQSIDMEKDTIKLKNVEVASKKHRPRLVNYKFRRGICTYHSGISSLYERATMAYNMPKGILKKLRFEFNNSAPREGKGKFTDTRIEVSLYDVEPNGDPGEKLASKIILVPGTHSGKMDVDVSDLGVRNENGIYISLRKIKKDNEKATDFEVDCSCKANKNHRTVIYNANKNKWQPAHGPYAFELTVTIEK